LLAGLGKDPEAEAAYRQAQAIFDKLAADFPTVPQYRQDLAASHYNLGVLLAGLGKRPEAEAAYRQALAIQEKLAADLPTVPEYRRDLAKSHNNLGVLLAGLGKHPEAEAAYRQALAIREKLAAEFPTVPQFRVELGGSQFNLWHLLRVDKEPERALEGFSLAIGTLEGVLREVNMDVTAQTFLRGAYWGRAMANDDLKRYAEAAADWDKAVQLSPEPGRVQFRLGRAASRVRAGQVNRALQEVEELTKIAHPTVLYDAARVFALAVDRREEPGGSLSKEECANRAIRLLQQAVAKGWKDAEHMKKDNDLKALRERDDFKNLVGDLEKAALPKEGKP
jgi:tetratricopeptide (TPR) repeat protein